MVSTRNNKKNKNCLEELPLREPVIYVSCSDFYLAAQNDYITFILDGKNQNDESLQEKKWNDIRKKSVPKQKRLNDFYMDMRGENPDRALYMGDDKTCDLAPYLENFDYLQRVYFTNVRSHVRGIVDALLSRVMVEKFFKLDVSDVEEDFIMLYFYSSKKAFGGYDRYKALATLHYYNRSNRVHKGKILIVRKDNTTEWCHRCDSHVAEIKKMVSQIRKAKNIAPYFSLDDIQNTRYYPNMKLNDSVWYPLKKKFSSKLGEITQLWCCNDSHRQTAFQHGVVSWKDPRLTPEILGFTDSYKKKILESILEVNRQDPTALDFEWMRVEPGFADKWPLLARNADVDNVFLDFEYTDAILYMVGMFYRGEYKVFWADRLDTESERRLVEQTNTFLAGLGAQTVVWYWHAEKSKWKSVCDKHGIAPKNDSWHDICHMMRSGTITVYGAFDFSLKSIVNAFFNRGKIPYCYSELDCMDGKESIEYAEQYYLHPTQKVQTILEKYNRLDCEAMSYVLGEIKNATHYNVEC